MATKPGTRARASVSAFTQELFGRLPRADQRRWAHAYMEGLLSTPGKKSVRRLAASVSDSCTAPQSLHQFINASPWAWEPVRAELTRWVQRHTAPRAWTIGLAVVPKRGDRSCGVHRRFVPQAGRTLNCQVGVGAFLSTDTEDVPVDWRLLLPDPWSNDPALRRRARIPESTAPRSAEAQTLDLVESLPTGGQLAEVPVVADLEGYADTGEIVRALSAQGRHFVVAVPAALPVLAVPVRHARTTALAVPAARMNLTASTGPTAPAAPAASAAPADLTVRQVLTRREAAPPHPVTVRTRQGEDRTAHVLTGLVRLPEPRTGPSRPSPATEHRPALRVFAEIDPNTRRPGRTWITSLTNRPPGELLELAALHAGTADTVRQLEDDFGLLAFEGRSYPGWHHHMTLVSAAFAYSSLTTTGRGGTR
ncbi:IS701 family transposase [Streptomyces sp. NPDC059618]|uniref:IS701 family transposase n=1 Tax=Streptomyces sp. NPDC059618 TaxID=3346887 RepID=UPI0036C24D45